MATRTWSELSTTQQRLIIAAGAVEIVLTTVALVDLVRRRPEQVRGPRWLWAAACLVQPVGPLGYLALGRR